MAKLERFEDIDAWQKARELTKSVYRITAGGQFARDFGLRDQIRRATVSVLSNIAEGFERSRDREFLHFLSLAKGSCGEVRAQLYVALDQAYIDEGQFQELAKQATEVSRLLSGFMKYLYVSDTRRVKAARP
jgi:four helix bundle protein